jgi:geranylgeranyl diphosphate synthase type II
MTEPSIAPFLRYSETVSVEINNALDAHTAYDEDCPKVLREAIRHSLMAGGKRLRPLLVLMSAEACGCQRALAMPAACAVEMVHTYSLIHDDLPAMDDDDWRRGQPSCHKVFGEALAILAGDALLAQALELISSAIRPPHIASICCRELAHAAGPSAMVGGQVDDLLGVDSSGDIDQLQRIHRRKTGAMFRVSLRLGAIIAGADQRKLAAVDDFGQKLGLAFQIVDDLLDVRGDAQSMGKSVGKDARQSKLTFPALLGPEESQRRAADSIQAAQLALEPLGPDALHLNSLACYVFQRSR